MIFVVSLFSNVFSFGANKEDLLHLHIASYQHYSLAEIHFSQGYFNISCH
jgi:hypothetical protein